MHSGKKKQPRLFLKVYRLNKLLQYNLSNEISLYAQDRKLSQWTSQFLCPVTTEDKSLQCKHEGTELWFVYGCSDLQSNTLNCFLRELLPPWYSSHWDLRLHWELGKGVPPAQGGERDSLSSSWCKQYIVVNSKRVPKIKRTMTWNLASEDN